MADQLLFDSGLVRVWVDEDGALALEVSEGKDRSGNTRWHEQEELDERETSHVLVAMATLVNEVAQLREKATAREAHVQELQERLLAAISANAR